MVKTKASKSEIPKVTVYITSYNYGGYVDEAIQSVLNQTYQDFELLVFDDGSTDNTRKILKKYEKHPKIGKIVYQKNIGLPRTCNKALKLAKGKYIMRLDADDFLDENALLVMSSVLDSRPEIGLVYPDYYEIDEKGEVISIVRRKKIGKEDKILDLPALGACTMIRKKCLEEIGGYSDDTKCQDNYDLWIKFIQKFKPYNVNLPLFYYRKHHRSLTTDSKKILSTRRHLKQRFIENNHKKKKPKTIVIIPTRGEIGVYPKLPLKGIGGKSLISYAINAASNAEMVNKVIVTSEDSEVLDHCKKLGVRTIYRPPELGKQKTPIEPTVNLVLKTIEGEGFYPDVVAVVHVINPLITSDIINEAINTLMIYDADSVVSVSEDCKLHYKHDKLGLKPLFKKRKLRLERETLYEEIGGLFISKREFVNDKNFLGKKISHIILNEDECVEINSKFAFWLAEQVIERKKLNPDKNE